MHIHLPKGLHNWREIAGEIVIIVVGVLIALFFEQLVQRWDWDKKVRAADDAMQRELFYDDGPQMVERASIQPCIDAQLDAIRAAVEAGRPRAEISTLIDRLYLPFVTYDSLAQRNATASDVSTHMSKARNDLWTQAYGMIPMVDETNAAETIDAARLRALKRTGGPLSDAEQIQLLQAVETLRADGLRMLSGIGWTMSVLPQLHGTFDPARLHGFMSNARLHYGTCVRDLPPDWPNTLLPPLPKGIAPGLPVQASGSVAASRPPDTIRFATGK
jgi:hypothetical protein